MNIQHKIISIGKIVIGISIFLTVTACQRDFTLLDTNGVIVGKGKLVLNANSPSPVYFTIEEKSFSGSWSTDKVYEADLAKRHRQISTSSYATYMQGNSDDQLKHGHAELTSEDGAQMECEFFYRTQPKFLDCKVDGQIMKLIISN